MTGGALGLSGLDVAGVTAMAAEGDDDGASVGSAVLGGRACPRGASCIAFISGYI